MTLISSILGEYSYHFVILVCQIPFLLFCMLLYARNLEKKDHYPIRLTLFLMVNIVIFFLLAVLRTHYEALSTRLFSYVFLYLIMLVMLFFCYRDSKINILLTWCAATATEDLASRLFTFLVAAVGHVHYETISLFSDFNEARDWGIYIGFRITFCLLFFLLFRKPKCLEAVRESIRRITGLSVFLAVWLIFFQGFSREFMRESDALYYILNGCGMTMSMAVLTFRSGVLSQNEYRREIAMMDKLLKEEQKQYDSIRENMEIVNMRCHDLKHQLEDLSYKLTKEEVAQLQDAIRIYDNSIKTGNEVLDVVIYEKQLIFEKEGIRFTCLADGSLLNFMKTPHVYSLFNNALGNALEAVRKLPDPEKKIIDLRLAKAGSFAEITVTNYFDGTLPEGSATTKSDKVHHGLGMKSMIYTAGLYGGTLETQADGEVFELTCRIPLQNA